MFKFGLFFYRLSKFVAFTAAKTRVFRARPATGMESGWLYAESCQRLVGVAGRKTEGLLYKKTDNNPFKIPGLKSHQHVNLPVLTML